MLAEKRIIVHPTGAFALELEKRLKEDTIFRVVCRELETVGETERDCVCARERERVCLCVCACVIEKELV